jgi:hypothetical protein
MKASVGDWVSTMGMSRSLARALRLPLDMLLSDFLSSYIASADDHEDDTISERLRRFMKGRDKEAMASDNSYIRQRSEFMSLGYKRYHNFLDLIAQSLETGPAPNPSPYVVDIQSAVKRAEKRHLDPDTPDETPSKKSKGLNMSVLADLDDEVLDFLFE